MTSLQRVNLVSVNQVPVGAFLRRLKSVGFIYASIRRRKDVSNRSVSLTYLLRRGDDESAWPARSRPIRDLNKTLLQRRMKGGIKSKKNFANNHFHNILRLFDVLPNSPFTASVKGHFY